MKTLFMKLDPSDCCAYQLNFPQTFSERLRGINRYSWASTHFAIVFESPCILHTFGTSKNLELRSVSLTPRESHQTLSFPPNSIALCSGRGGWIMESFATRQNLSSDSRTKKACASNNSLDEIRIINCNPFLMIIRLAAVVLSLALITSISLANSKLTVVKMQVGESKEVALEEAPRSLDLSQPDVIDVQRIGTTNKILITALKSGSSSLTTRFHSGQIKSWNFQVGQSASIPSSVASLSSASLLRTAREIQKRTGLEVTLDNGRIALFGHIQNETQVRALIETCLDREECLPRFSLSEAAGIFLASQLQSHFDQFDGAEVKVLVHLGGLILKGTVHHEVLHQRIIKLAQSIFPRVSGQILIERASQALIESQLSFFRISHTGLTSLGVTTTPESSLPSGALAQIKVPPQSAKLKNGPVLGFRFPELLLQAYSQKGVIQQIAQPSVVIASGGRGEILSGGELLFQTQGQVQKFFSQTYGISVVLQPRIIHNERILQKIDLKITHPQADPSNNAISSMSSSVLNTEISSQPGEQLLLTRITQKSNGKSVNKIPLVGHLPIIGELFKARDLSDEDAELWIALKSSISPTQVVPSSLDAPSLEKETPHAHWLD